MASSIFTRSEVKVIWKNCTMAAEIHQQQQQQTTHKRRKRKRNCVVARVRKRRARIVRNLFVRIFVRPAMFDIVIVIVVTIIGNV